MHTFGGLGCRCGSRGRHKVGDTWTRVVGSRSVVRRSLSGNRVPGGSNKFDYLRFGRMGRRGQERVPSVSFLRGRRVVPETEDPATRGDTRGRVSPSTPLEEETS